MLANARKTSLFSYLALSISISLPLNATLPKISQFDRLERDDMGWIASGNVQIDYDNIRMKADQLRYYNEYSLADAQGSVAITHDGSRLLADRLSFDAEESVFSADILRTGQWPYYVSGVSAGGSVEDVTIQGATLFYGEPSPFGLSASADQVRKVIDDTGEYVSIRAATLRVGPVPIFYLPGYQHYLSDAPYLIDVSGGSDSQLGFYLQTTTLFPVASWLRAGANLDYYSKRGPLAGPTAQYVYNASTQSITGALSTGYIEDQGDASERGVDILNRPIDAERGFLEWRHKHHIGERFTATASLSYWSDSEVTRDFREDLFDANQRPDTFAEAVYAGDNFFLSTFGRFRPNNFQVVQERLPEVRFDLLPVPILKTGAYHRASASYVQLREDIDDNAPAIITEGKSDRFDLTYRIERPFRLAHWLTFTPLAGARLTQYDNQQIDATFLTPPATALPDDRFNREIYELGFDLEARAHASYPTVNETWGIDGLRHLMRPVLRYRYFSDPDDVNEIAAIDRQVFDLKRPLLNLGDLRHVDQISETHLVRLGVENLFQTRAREYGSRTLAALNFYQDILFEKKPRYDGGEEDTFNATWVELVLNPAPWLKFDLASRFKTEQLTLEELRTRTTLRSGEIWELGLSTDLLNQRIDQYRLDFMYRINERYAFLSDLNFDADTGELTKVSLGLRTRLGSTWQLFYAVTFREDARRESDVEFHIQARLNQGE